MIGMDYTYHLLSSYGIEVIIIPELDCRINVFNLTESEVVLAGKIFYATIIDKSYAFQAAGSSCIESWQMEEAIRWYGYNRKYPHLGFSLSRDENIKIITDVNKPDL